MKIAEIGGEFALIDRLIASMPSAHADLIAGAGDDAAVIRISPEPAPLMLVTTDLLVEDRHFNCLWAEPEQIGIKAAECNISDIAAMGGRPTWMFISIALKKSADVDWVRKIYAGISASCRRYGVVVAGGDTTQSPTTTINITLLGTISPSDLCLRSHARPSDLLMVTGSLGASAAALSLLRQGHTPSEYLLEKHLTPRSRMDVAETIAPFANAMIDVSDGLGAEVGHICRMSRLGAEVHLDAIPLHSEVIAAGQALGIDPHDFALQGGEDFELLFTIPAEKMPLLAKKASPFHEVGKMTAKNEDPVLVTADGHVQALPGGYDHFS